MNEGGGLELASLATETGPLEKRWGCSFAAVREQTKEEYRVEQGHRGAKRITRPMLGFGSTPCSVGPARRFT
jgi:hypothetical protein